MRNVPMAVIAQQLGHADPHGREALRALGAELRAMCQVRCAPRSAAWASSPNSMCARSRSSGKVLSRSIVVPGCNPYPRRLVANWIPWHTVTGVYGDCGLGKPLLVQQLVTCTSIGHPRLGIPTPRVKSPASSARTPRTNCTVGKLTSTGFMTANFPTWRTCDGYHASATTTFWWTSLPAWTCERAFLRRCFKRPATSELSSWGARQLLTRSAGMSGNENEEVTFANTSRLRLAKSRER